MSFTLAWLDSSDHERRRALDIIDLFNQTETVDVFAGPELHRRDASAFDNGRQS